MSQQIYNGIFLPDAWPSGDVDEDTKDPLAVPYLEDPSGVCRRKGFALGCPEGVEPRIFQMDLELDGLAGKGREVAGPGYGQADAVALYGGGVFAR